MKAAIFDLDGTILNSMGMWRRLEQNFLTGLGIEPSDWIFRRMDTLGLHGSAGWLIGEFHLDKKEQELWDFCDRLALDAYLKTVSPKRGAVSYTHLPRGAAHFHQPKEHRPLYQARSPFGNRNLLPLRDHP